MSVSAVSVGGASLDRRRRSLPARAPRRRSGGGASYRRASITRAELRKREMDVGLPDALRLLKLYLFGSCCTSIRCNQKSQNLQYKPATRGCLSMAALVEGDGDPLLRVVARAFPRSRCWSAAPPSALAACGEDVLVSVVTPTTPGRRWTHRSLYRCFAQQTWPWKELVVLETGGAPSPFWEATARNDGRVRYAHDENDAALGAKRRRLAEAARGDVVAHFDDDDLYGPNYLDGLVATLLEGGRDGAAKAEEPRVATLVSWLSLDVETGRVAAYDVDDDRRAVEAALGGAVGDRAAAERLCARSLGYGFSFAYTKAAAALAPFDDAISRQEDWQFLTLATSRGAALGLRRDDFAKPLCLHLSHNGRSSTNPVTTFAVDAAGVRAALGTFLRDLCTILPRHHDRHRTMLADAQRAR